MSFTETEKVDLRRFMGYSAYGTGDAGFNNFRFFERYMMVEYRMNHLGPEEETFVRSLLTQIRQLETDLYGARDSVDTAAAAVWTRNPDELRERMSLYTLHRQRLCAFFGAENLGSGRNVPLVV